MVFLSDRHRGRTLPLLTLEGRVYTELQYLNLILGYLFILVNWTGNGNGSTPSENWRITSSRELSDDGKERKAWLNKFFI